MPEQVQFMLAPEMIDSLIKWVKIKSQTYESVGESMYAKGVFFREFRSRGFLKDAEDAQFFDLSLLSVNSCIAVADVVDVFTRSRTHAEKQVFLQSMNKEKFLQLCALRDIIDEAADKVIRGVGIKEIFKSDKLRPAVVRAHVEEDSPKSLPVSMEVDGSARHKKIVELREKGISLGMIGNSLSMPKSSVQSELERHREGRCACIVDFNTQHK
ncbi:MAG: hypothetical protein ACRECH_16150 [Nitrososphaerales archaeon]